jgi:hypothetical protein
MRLLEAGSLRIHEFFGEHVPQYAILSHTWGDGEVTFGDLVHEQYKHKPGFNKMRYCSEQATKDGLQYIWMDTCCIDKSSSAELSKAINSMFRWYRDAVACYIYLSDVAKPLDDDQWVSVTSASQSQIQGHEPLEED